MLSCIDNQSTMCAVFQNLAPSLLPNCQTAKTCNCHAGGLYVPQMQALMLVASGQAGALAAHRQGTGRACPVDPEGPALSEDFSEDFSETLPEALS
jgi:hypothetical protein